MKEGLNPGRNRKEKMKRAHDMVKFLSGNLEKPKNRKTRCDKGGTHERPEDNLRNDIINELRKSGFEVKRLENSIIGKNNNFMPDLWISYRKKEIAGWIEVKTWENWNKNKLNEGQNNFRQDCRAGGVKHWVIRELKELDLVKIGEVVYMEEIDALTK